MAADFEKIHFYRTELTTAARIGDVERVSSILSRTPEGFDLNYKSPKFIDPKCSGVTPPLIAASGMGQLEVVKLLVQREGVEVNIVQTHHIPFTTPLSAAAAKGYIEVMKVLIEKGADVDCVRDADSHFCAHSALCQATSNNQYEAAALLLGNGASIGDDSYFLLASAVPINSIRDTSTEKDTKMKLFKLLLEHGANIDSSDPEHGISILILVCRRGSWDCARLLIERGVDVTDKERHKGLLAVVTSVWNVDKEFLTMLLERGVDVNDTDDDEKTPLMMASSHNDIDIVQLLLKYNADVNISYQHGTALSLVCTQRHHTRDPDLEIAKLLIENGADVNHVTVDGGPILTRILSKIQQHHQPETDPLYNSMMLLLKNNADVNLIADIQGKHTTPLIFAVQCMWRGEKIVKELLSYGGIVNKQVLSEALQHCYTNVTRNYYNDKEFYFLPILELLLKHAAEGVIQEDTEIGSFLVKAVHHNHYGQYGAASTTSSNYKIAELLLHFKANANTVYDGTTALIEASSHGYEEFTKLLLDHRAKVNIRNRYGDSPLTIATERNQAKCVELLLGREDIDVDIKVHNGSDETSLMIATRCGHTEITKLLVDHSAQIDIRNEDGNSALMLATQKGKTECIQLLLGVENIDVNSYNKSWESALIIAVRCGHNEISKLLLEHGANPNLQNSDGNTALMIASERGNVAIIQQLLQHGADLEMLDVRECSALFYAVKSNSPDVVKLFLDKGVNISRKTIDGKTLIQFAFDSHMKPDVHMIEMLKEACKQTIPSDEKPLELKDAFRILVPLASHWQNIGALLGISTEEMNSISAATKIDCLREMLTIWLKSSDPGPTWSSLAEAVEPIDLSKAGEIRRKYCYIPASKTYQPDEDQDTVEEQKEEAKKNNTEENVDISDSEDESSTPNTEDPSLEEHFAAVEKAMKEKGTLKHTLSHGMMVGPARSGKSSLTSRLAGEMPISDSPSTGVAEKVIQVVGVHKSHSIALSVQDTIWFKLLYDQEAIRLMKLATQNITSQPQQPATTQLTTVITQPTSTLIQSEVEITSPMEQSHVSAPVCTTEQSNTTPFLKEDFTAPYPEGYIPPMEVFKAATTGKELESLRQHFKNSWSFYLTDTGGQVEFQDLVPLLVSGPSVFFFTFRLDQDLNQRFTIEYHLPEGRRSKPYQSTLTVVEAILQTLASVASMGTFTYKGPHVKSASSKPKVFIVGTHKDKLNPATAESEIKEIDQHLQEVIMSTSHYDQDIIQFASESQLIFTVNNFSEDDSDFKKIQLGVERVVCCNSQFKARFPTHWLIFSLVLRQEMIKDKIISYDQCFSIAKDCGITDTKELDHALWFLHTKVGVIRHFPVPGLQEFVIREPQILFDMITKLILNTFTFENTGKKCSMEFEQRGIFTFESFLKLQNDTLSMFPPEKLIRLLIQLQIIAPFQEGDQEKFFIPCVLAQSEECEFQSLPQSINIPPMLITFNCGYCPKGLAGALIVYLLSNKMGSKFKWELKTKKIHRNQVSFLISSCDIITLKIHPTFLELIHSSDRNSSATDGIDPLQQSICNEIRHSIESGIRHVSLVLNLTSNAEHSLSFYCRNSACNSKRPPHPASDIVEDGYGFVKLWCRKSDEVVTSDLPSGYSVWFQENKSRQDLNTKPASTAEASVNQEHTKSGHNDVKEAHPGLATNDPKLNQRTPKQIGHSDTLDGCDYAKIVKYLKILNRSQIVELGTVLGLNVFELENMTSLPGDMVKAWLRKEGKVTENSGTPTWSVLITALTEIGQTGVADDIERKK